MRYFQNMRTKHALAKEFAIVGALCVVSLIIPAPASAQATVETLDSCLFDDPEGAPEIEKECGYVVVPENPDLADGPSVKLAYLRMPARSDTSEAPLFMLAGGPGDTDIKPTTLMLFNDAFLGRILNDRDVVLLNQRGALNSIPTLDCPEAYGLPWEVQDRELNEADILALERQILKDCVASARTDGIDPAQYNSVRIAADINAARQALGYDQIVYYGASYGAQLGQHYMRDFPETLEAVILDGANSLSRKSWVQERVRDVDVAIKRLSALCEADAKCGAAYDVPDMIDQAMALFDEGPISTTFQNPADPDMSFDLTVTERDLAEAIYGFQTGQIGIHALPAVLDLILAEGRTSAAAFLGEQKGSAILASEGATEGGFAMLMHMAVVCSDDPVTSPDDLIVEDDASRYARVFGESVLEEYLEFCGAVDVPSLPDSTDVDVTTDVPTLILAGQLDARTPAIRSELVAETLPRATIVEFPEGTHVQLGEINLCAGEVLQAFLASPDAPLDTSCIAEIPRRGFVLPDGTLSIE